MRIAILALLLAVAAPLLVRGIGQVTYEHTELIEAFETNKEKFFRQRGWALDSPSARIYERGGVVSAVCHGPAGLVNVKLSNGSYLVTGKNSNGENGLGTTSRGLQRPNLMPCP